MRKTSLSLDVDAHTDVSEVKPVLKSKVHLFDTVSAYGNEKKARQSIREGTEEPDIKWEEIFPERTLIASA